MTATRPLARPNDAGWPNDLAAMDYGWQIGPAPRGEDPGSGGARPGALSGHEPARARLHHRKATRLRAKAARAGAERVRHPGRFLQPRVHHRRAPRLPADADIARTRQLLPEGHRRLPPQAASLQPRKSARGRLPAHEEPGTRRVPARPLQHQEVPVRVLVRIEALRIRAADDRQGRYHGLPVTTTFASNDTTLRI